MKPVSHIFRLALFALVALLALAPRCPGAETLVLISVKTKTTALVGVLLNSEGFIALPAPAADDLIAEYEGERYSVKIVSEQAKYGLVIAKIERQKPFPASVFTQRQAAGNAVLRLTGLDASGAMTEKTVSLSRVRRRVPEMTLNGSFYELIVNGDCPSSGAVLTDAKTGEIYGMLIAAKGDNGERYALFGADINERVASANIVLGSDSQKKGPQIVFANGREAGVRLRNLEFRAMSAEHTKSSYVSAAQDWRNNTGFWLNALTSPVLEGPRSYFGSMDGTVYSVDMTTMQREWIFQNYGGKQNRTYPVYFPPSVSGDVLCIGSGSLNLKARTERDSSLAGVVNALGAQYGYNLGFLNGMFTIKHTNHILLDEGLINCVDRKTGAFKWQYETRFVSQPQIVGDKVIFTGMEALGVLNLADGKPVWARESDRNKENPIYYTIGGVTENTVWTLGLPTHVIGGGNTNPAIDPLRLEQDHRDAVVERYAMDAPKSKGETKKPLWSTHIRTGSGAPAMSGMMIISPDKKICYGANAKDVFAVNAENGRLLWQTPIFAKQFGGSITYGDSYLLATGSDYKLYAINTADGKLAWTFDETKMPLCIPLVADGVVYVGCLDTNFYAVDVRTGRRVWKMETTGKVCGQPRLVGGKLYYMSDDGRMTELEMPQ